MTSLLDRFAAKVTITHPSACWQWTAIAHRSCNRTKGTKAVSA